jgi:hypothetical protein
MTSISLEQFKELPRKKQIAIHEEMKNTMGVEGILKQWNLSRSKYYYMLRKLKLRIKTKRSTGMCMIYFVNGIGGR